MPVPLIDPKTGAIYDAEDEDQARRQVQAYGLQMATPEEVSAYDESRRAPVAPAAPAAQMPDAGAPPPDTGIVPGANGKIQLVDPKNGLIFEADDEDMAQRQMLAYGLERAKSDQITTYDERIRSRNLVGALKSIPETLGGMAGKVLEAASKTSAPGFYSDINYPDPEVYSPTYKPQAIKAEEFVPFAFTPAARERRRVNEEAVTATTVAADIGTGILIPGHGLGGILASSVASGALTEAGTSLVTGDEFSVANAALFAGTAIAFEGAGALAFKGAMAAKGKIANYLDGTIDRARRAAADGAVAEGDALVQAEKFRRNSEALYDQHQTSLNEALGVIDQRMAEAPERMFTPSALKKSVSGNETAQADAFLDVAVKFDNAAQVADVPGLPEIAESVKDALGKNGPNMFATLRQARRDLEALGSDSPLVQEVMAAADESLRSQNVWGKAAKNYADAADDLAADGGKIGYDVRKLEGRDVIDDRLDRARRNATLTGDKKMQNAVKRAQQALDESDKVTGAKIMAETGPDEIKALQKQLDGFEKRAPKLADEISSSYGKLRKAIDDVNSPDITPDEAIDYVTARVTGLTGKRDPMRGVITNAEKRIAEMRGSGAQQGAVARAEKALAELRKGIDEVNAIPAAAKRIRDYNARPQPGQGLISKLTGKAGAAADSFAEDEIGNALQPVLRGGLATAGGHLFGVPGLIGGYLTGRLVDKKFGPAIARFLWKRAKKEAAKHTRGEIAGGAAAAAGAALWAGPHGAIVAPVIGGYAAGRAAVKAVKGKLGHKAAGEATEGAKKAVAKAAKAVDEAAKQADKAAAKVAKSTKAAREELESFTRVNKAEAQVKAATTDEARAAAQKEYEAALVAHSEAEKRGFKPASVGRRVVNAIKRNPGRTAGAVAVGAGTAAAAADEDGQTPGAAAASAGLLLLLLPRGIGYRTAMDTLERKSAQLVEDVTPDVRTRLDRIIGELREENANVFRAAVRNDADTTPEALITQQARRVHAEFASSGRGLATYPTAEGQAATQYVRNELWRENLETLNYDGELLEMYNTAHARATMQDAERIANSSPNAPPAEEIVQRQRISDMAPEQLGSLRAESVARGRQLTDNERLDVRAIFGDTHSELSDMARRYADGELPGTVEDLIRAQGEVLERRATELGVTVPTPRLEAMSEAAHAELRRINAEVASGLRSNFSSRLPTPVPEAGPEDFMSRSAEERLQAFTNESGRAQAQRLNDAMSRLSTDANLAMDRAGRGQAEHNARMIDEFVRNGYAWDPIRARALNTPEEVIEYQTDQVLRAFAADERYGLGTPDAASEAERQAAREMVMHTNGSHASEEFATQARATREQRLKPSDDRETPAAVDGLSWEAATRLDDAMSDDLNRIVDRFDAQENDNTGLAMIVSERQGIVDRARQFARENPGLVSEDDAAAYVQRRLDTIGSENGIEWLDEGFARYTAQGEPDETAIRDSVLEMVREQAYDAGGDTGVSLDTRRIMQRLDRDTNMTPRERRLAQRILDEDETGRHFDEIVERDRADMDSEPPSSDGGGSYGRDEGSDGLPNDEELHAIGVQEIEMNNTHGVDNVFGQDLDTDDITNLFGLEHLHDYASKHDLDVSTKLEINRNDVKFEGTAGNFDIDCTYRRADGDLKLTYGVLKLPLDEQGQGIAKELIRNLVPSLENLGVTEVQMNAAWIGKYAWLAMGARPSEWAEQRCINEFRGRLVQLAGGESPMIAEYMSKITNTQQLSQAWLPVELIKDRLPELRQGWEELGFALSGTARLQPFDEAVMRTSRSGNQQFLAGKFFLLASSGPWNEGLSIKIRPGEAYYENMKKMLGLGVGVAALGFGIHELMGAFENHTLTLKGVQQGATPPPEVQAYSEQQRARDEQIDGTREKLGYLKTEGDTLVRDTARAIANPAVRDRPVKRVEGVTTSQGVASFLGSHSTLREAFDDRKATLQRMQQDPMVLVDELTEGLAELQENAPELHEQLVAQTYKVVGFLNSKLPGTVGASLARPEGSPPSDIAMRQFALYFSAATDPSSVMGDLGNNRARREQVDTLREVWPDVYSNLKMAVVKQMAENRPTVAQRIRMDLLFDFGQDLDRALSPGLVAALDQYRQEQAQKAGGPQSGGQVPSRRTQPSVAGTGALPQLGLGPASGPGTLA